MAWLYQHFKAQSSHKASWLIAIIKTALSIFFSYFMFANLNKLSAERQTPIFWPAGLTWAVLTGVTIGSTCHSLLASPLAVMAAGPAWMGLQFMVIRSVQAAANLSMADVTGERNSTMTIGNWAWMIPCVLYWALIAWSVGMLVFYAL